MPPVADHEPDGIDSDQSPPSQLLAATGVEMMSTMQEFIAHLAERAGTTPQQLLAFGAIRRGDATRVSELATHTATSPSAVSRTVDALVAAGHVVRGVDPDDRRAQVLSASESGEAWATELDVHVESLLSRAAQDMPYDDIQLLVRTQLELSRRLRELLRSTD